MNTGSDSSLITAIIILTVLTLPIKGLALWRSSHNDQKPWFIGLFIFNTLGMLDLAYLFYFTKPKKQAKSVKPHKHTPDK